MKKDLAQFLSNADTLDNSIFGKEPKVPDLEERDFEILNVPSHINSTVSDASFDYVYSRAILYSLINKAGVSLEMVTQLAKINQDSKSYQTANDIMATMMNMIKLLNNNHKLHREVQGMENLNENTSTTTPDIKFKGSVMDLKAALNDGSLK
jgi:hypothetical protein